LSDFMRLLKWNDSGEVIASYEPEFIPDDQLLSYGVSYLDEALIGILKSDLILVTAESGAGKTQFVTNIAMANIMRGKRVHMIALEARQHEIEARIKFSRLATAYYEDPTLNDKRQHLRYINYIRGRYNELLRPYFGLLKATGEMKNLKTYYREKSFNVEDMSTLIRTIKHETDLIIIDHVHYLDYDEEQQNQALKLIAKETRDLALITGKPIILVAHIRKQDLKNKTLAPHREDIHGSSDLGKIATAVITLGRGAPASTSKFRTYVRIAKSRDDGSLENYVAECLFDIKKLSYDKKYKVGYLSRDGKKLVPIEKKPDWMKNGTDNTNDT